MTGIKYILCLILNASKSLVARTGSKETYLPTDSTFQKFFVTQMVFIDFFLRPRIGNNKTRRYDWFLLHTRKTIRNQTIWLIPIIVYQTKRNLEKGSKNKSIIVDPVCACNNVGNTVKMQRMMLMMLQNTVTTTGQ